MLNNGREAIKSLKIRRIMPENQRRVMCYRREYHPEINMRTDRYLLINDQNGTSDYYASAMK